MKNCNCKNPYYVYKTYSICLKCYKQISDLNLSLLGEKYDRISNILFLLKKDKNIVNQRKKKINKIYEKI